MFVMLIMLCTSSLLHCSAKLVATDTGAARQYEDSILCEMDKEEQLRIYGYEVIKDPSYIYRAICFNLY